MKTRKIEFYEEKLYTHELKNGLKIYILPNNDVEDIFVTLTCKYGGVNYPFMYNNNLIKVPNGIAHFLEHKMFEQEDGIDPFMFFGKNGTYCNAATNYYNTSYIFAGSRNFEENINYLLDCIQKPYFTDENVLKEKGIITEEIKMYEDMPDRIIYEKILYNIFNKHPIKHSIGGTIKDINKITKEDLYNVYNTFYQPSNMFLTITGNVDAENCINIIEKNQNEKEFQKLDINIKYLKEIDKVSKEYEEINYNVAIPYIAYGIKIPIKKYKNIEPKLRNMYLSTLFNLLFDETSLFYEDAKEKNIIDTPIEIESIDTNEHKIFILLFKSSKYKEAIQYIEKVLNNINIIEFDLERKKKVYISQMLYILDDISESNRILVSDIILYDKLYVNIYKLINKMNIDEFNTVIKNLNLSNTSTFIIKNMNS